MVIWSTNKSIEKKEISFLAIIEVIISVMIYWLIALYFNTYWHIAISILITPFLLLQSNQSIKMALDIFLYIIKKISNALDKPLVLAFFFLLMMLAAVFMIVNFFDMSDGIFKTTISIILVCIAFLIILSEDWKSIFSKHSKFILITIVPFTFILVTLGIDFIIDTSYKGGLAFLSATVVPIGIILFTAFFSKFIAVVVNIHHGYKKFLENWFYHNFIIDIKKIPEIIFDIEKRSDAGPLLKLSKINRLFQVHYDYGDKILESFRYVVFYVFALFYRLSIKSTFWFYLPLFFLVKSPSKLENDNEISSFLSSLSESKLAFWRFIFGAIVLTSFFLTVFDILNFREWSSSFIFIKVLYYLDFSKIELWQTFQLFVAVATIGLYFYSDYILTTKVNYNQKVSKSNWSIKSIFYINNVRNFFSFLYFISAFIFLFSYLKIWEYPYVPNFFKDFFTTLVGYISFHPF